MDSQACEYFHISRWQMRIGRQSMHLPVYRCTLGETVALSLQTRDVRHAYGPDGKLVSRLSCSLRRLETSCGPARARMQRLMQRTRSAHEDAHKHRLTAALSRSESRSYRSSGADLRSRCAETRLRSMQLRSQSELLVAGLRAV